MSSVRYKSSDVLAIDTGQVARISDNLQKGLSEIPAVTTPACCECSATHFEDSLDRVVEALIAGATPCLGGDLD